MRPDKIGRGSSGETAAPRFVGKGRYTTTPPMTATAVERQGPEIEVQVGDVTVIVDDDIRFDKYSARSAPAYRSREAIAVEEEAEPEAEHAVLDLLVDEQVPVWTEWRSEVVSSSVGYHRRETRLPAG